MVIILVGQVLLPNTLLRDYLQGLGYLHEYKGVMHRVRVVFFDAPNGILLDLDSATRDEESKDDTQGTMRYMAPEIIQLKLEGKITPHHIAKLLIYGPWD